MQHGLMNMAWSAALVVMVGGHANAEIEVQTGRVVGERFGNGPVGFTADPFYKFDPMGGTRRLDRVTVYGPVDWECVVQLANPEPVVQEVRYNALPIFAEFGTSTSVHMQIDLFNQPYGTLIADPFQTVQNVHTQFGGLFYSVDATEPMMLQTLVGTESIQIERFSFGTPFDTRRWVNGVPMLSPNGFSVFRERWELDMTWEFQYTLVPAPATTVGMLAGLLMAGQTSRRRP